MPKILILDTCAFKGGTSGGSYIQAGYYTKLLRQKGYSTELFAGDPQEHQIKRAWRVIKKIRKSDFVLGFGTPLLDLYLQWACFFLGKKGIFCIDTIIVPLSIIHDHFKRKIFMTRAIFSFTKKLLYDKLVIRILPPRLNLINLASCGYVAEKIKNTSFKTQMSSFVYPRVVLKKDIKQQKNKEKIVLYYGHLYRGRGVLDLVKACRMLWKKGYEFKLFILAWPVEKLTKKALIADLAKNGNDRIIIKGKIRNIRKYIISATVVVLPFRYPCAFQTPFTILEPMALRVPVITTDVGSHAEWVRDGVTGLICKEENPADIAQKIERIFNDKRLVQRITAGAWNFSKKRYSQKDILLETLKRLEITTVILLFSLKFSIFCGTGIYKLTAACIDIIT